MAKAKNNLSEKFRAKRLNELTGEAKEEHLDKLFKNIDKTLKENKDRFLFFVPDLDVVNPLSKLMYDLALEAKESGLNAFIVHEKEGFSARWLLNYKKEYEKLPVLFTKFKAGKKSRRLKSSFQIMITDNIFIPDVHLELIQDFNSIKEFAALHKTLVVSGYSGLYSLNPGSNLHVAGVNDTIIFDKQVHSDYQMLFPDVIHYYIPSYKIENLQNVNLEDEEGYVKEPYVLISGVGNNERINQFVNIFYNRYPNLKFLKFRLVNRRSYSGYLLNVKDALVFIDFDRMYVTNTNSQTAKLFKVPFLSTNGFENNNLIDNNILEQSNYNDMFKIAEFISKILLFSLTNPDSALKADVQGINENMKGIFENSVKETLGVMREIKIANFNKLTQ